MDKPKPRILIMHDYFLYHGGGERLIITMAKRLGADIATAFIGKDAFDPRKYGIKTYDLAPEGRLSHLPGMRHLKVQWTFLRSRKLVKDYDVIIYSGDCMIACLSARDKVNIAYMHTPPRHLYDNYQSRLQQYGFIKKLLFIPYAIFSRWRFKSLSQRMNLIIANSQAVHERIRKYLGLESTIVYPPCDTDKFKWIAQGDYFFSWARLYDLKRVDQIVEAFTHLPDKKLIVASGGPELAKIEKIAAGHPNIQLLNWVSDEKLLELVGNCLATVYIPIREDFGMTPVESMSAGKPVIGVNEGGLKETIIDGKTGILLRPDFTIVDIAAAVQQLTPQLALTMKDDCIKRAHDFDEQKFSDGMQAAIDQAFTA